MKTRAAAIVITVALSGCATTSEIVPYGKDSYLLAAEDAWGGHSQGALQVKAAKAAAEFCGRQNKVFVVRNTNASGVAGWTSTSSTLIFSCVDEQDPEYQRPNLRREPSTVIEDRRK